MLEKCLSVPGLWASTQFVSDSCSRVCCADVVVGSQDVLEKTGRRGLRGRVELVVCDVIVITS